MRTLIIIVTAFLLSLGGVHAEENDLFVRANAAYASGKYSDAIRDLEQLVGRKDMSPGLFFNLGNAYFRDGKPGQAILNYERALWLDPTNPDARANLQLARKTAGLFEPTRTWWQTAAAWRSLTVEEVLGSVAWFSFVLFLLACWWNPIEMLGDPALEKPGSFAARVRWAWVDCHKNLKIVTVAAAVMTIVCFTTALMWIPELNRAVVLVADAPLRVAPLEKSPAPSTLKAGDVVRIENQRGPFFYVETEDGKTGWATGAEVQPIISHF